jgi:hypothetical protein
MSFRRQVIQLGVYCTSARICDVYLRRYLIVRSTVFAMKLGVFEQFIVKVAPKKLSNAELFKVSVEHDNE